MWPLSVFLLLSLFFIFQVRAVYFFSHASYFSANTQLAVLYKA